MPVGAAPARDMEPSTAAAVSLSAETTAAARRASGSGDQVGSVRGAGGEHAREQGREGGAEDQARCLFRTLGSGRRAMILSHAINDSLIKFLVAEKREGVDLLGA